MTRISVPVNVGELLDRNCPWDGCIHQADFNNGHYDCKTFKGKFEDMDSVFDFRDYEFTCNYCETEEQTCQCGGTITESRIDGHPTLACSNTDCPFIW